MTFSRVLSNSLLQWWPLTGHCHVFIQQVNWLQTWKHIFQSFGGYIEILFEIMGLEIVD